MTSWHLLGRMSALQESQKLEACLVFLESQASRRHHFQRSSPLAMSKLQVRITSQTTLSTALSLLTSWSINRHEKKG